VNLSQQNIATTKMKSLNGDSNIKEGGNSELQNKYIKERISN
jgi:hypothetical protein